MSKNILVLSPIYPGPNIPEEFTPVVHYFTKEWVKQGHNVIVVNNIAYYSKVFYWISTFFSGFLSNFFGAKAPRKAVKSADRYEIDGVKVYLRPMYKPIPRRPFSRKVYNKQLLLIEEILRAENIIPDCIIGHWGISQLELVSRLKEAYKDSRSCIVMHNDNAEKLIKNYRSNFDALIKNIDIWGFRSETIRNGFYKKVGEKKSFICYSGVSSVFLTNSNFQKINKHPHDYIFVGMLIKRKYPSELIKSISDAVYNNDFHLTYVGDGVERKKILNLSKKIGVIDNVEILGRIERDQVKIKMDAADCFIMISKNETFGLVYLEAMSSGCITIASRNEGMDGIIQHGHNGFLCEAGNTAELTILLTYINSLPLERLRAISANAISTARQYSDEFVAKKYIDFVLYA